MTARNTIVAFAASLMLTALAPAVAGAYATPAPPSAYSTAAGLPDGRLYQQVSPSNKHGYQAGAVGLDPEVRQVRPIFSVASPDGDAIAYGSEGPAGDTNSSGLSRDFVAERTVHGWVSRASTARGLGQNERISTFSQAPYWREYTPDLSHLAYAITGPDVPSAPVLGAGNYYLSGADPLQEPTWLFSSLSSPALEDQPPNELVGMSPDASIVYVAYEGKLLPQDASRSGVGLYEWRNGVVVEAGVLPDGSVPATGAKPVASATTGTNQPGENNPASLDNQVSEDGLRLFFVSGGQLYVHEIEGPGERSVLVSASQVSGHEGEAAPDGVALFENPTKNAGDKGQDASAPTYAYASPDGSHVFFQSQDQLTGDAPADTSLKVYDFDVDTESLEYLPGVALGGIVTAAKDGSSFAFVNRSTTPNELDLWSAGPEGGAVSKVAQLPGGGFVGPGRLVASNSVLVFQSSAPIAGFNDEGGEQVFHYDTKTNSLDCVSCPPEGVRPSGSSFMSPIDQYLAGFGGGLHAYDYINDVRAVSSDGSRVFFDSPDPLVARDTNGQLDVYEWENGTVFLLSAGTGPEYSMFLDNSESGNDVFFATADELVQGDNDAGFDVYDARVPRPGDNPPPEAVPCSGDVCQGPPSVAELLGPPPSATFDGAGNVAESPPVGSVSVRKASKAKKLQAALRTCRKRANRRRRATCERRARKRYQAAKSTAKSGREGNR